MKRRRPPTTVKGRTIPAVVLAFAAGGLAGFWLHVAMSSRVVAAPMVTAPMMAPAAPAVAAGDATPPAARIPDAVATIGVDPVADLRRRGLRMPLEGLDAKAMKGGFLQRRDRGSRPHEAVDLMAAESTPVRAVEEGTIAKLFNSKAGGITIYQFDPTEHFCYYYAHLSRYAEHLAEGQHVSAGDVIGYVGSTGNASPGAPHLHFAIFQLTSDRHWWEGTPIDPYCTDRLEKVRLSRTLRTDALCSALPVVVSGFSRTSE